MSPTLFDYLCFAACLLDFFNGGTGKFLRLNGDFLFQRAVAQHFKTVRFDDLYDTGCNEVV